MIAGMVVEHLQDRGPTAAEKDPAAHVGEPSGRVAREESSAARTTEDRRGRRES
jgi:hypothetical protein